MASRKDGIKDHGSNDCGQPVLGRARRGGRQQAMGPKGVNPGTSRTHLIRGPVAFF